MRPDVANDDATGSVQSREANISFRPSIALVLSVCFALLLILAGGAILRFSFGSGVESTQSLIADKVVLIVEEVATELNAHLNPARQITENLAALVGGGVLNPTDPVAMQVALSAARTGSPQVRSVLFLSPDGMVTGWDSTREGGSLFVEDWGSRPDARRRLDTLERYRMTKWGDAVFVPDLELTVLNVAAPVVSGADFLGAFIATVSVDELSRHMASLPAAAGEVAFALSGRDALVAHPTLVKPLEPRNAESPLQARQDSEDPIMRRLWHPEFVRESRGVDLPSEYQLQVVSLPEELGGHEHVVAFRDQYGFGDQTWIVGVHFPLDVIGGPLQSVIKGGIAGLIVLVVGVLAAVMLAMAISRPWRQLQRAAIELRDHGPQHVVKLPPSRLKEVGAAYEAFNGMVSGLRERELIRDLFGRFVPEEVAQSLLSDRGNLEPQTREATVLFSDIAGFSSLAEGLQPELLVGLLNEYFELANSGGSGGGT